MLWSPEVDVCVEPLFNVVGLRHDLNAVIPFRLGAKVSALFVGNKFMCLVSYMIKELQLAIHTQNIVLVYLTNGTFVVAVRLEVGAH